MAALVETTGLTKTYPGGVRALDQLDLELAAGVIGLVGANGAGKSTLFRVLLGLTRPDAGSVHVAGRDVATDPVGVRRLLGYMPEHDCLPADQSASDLVSMLGELAGLPPRAARQRASHVLDLVGLDEARFRPLEGFSTGMRQRAKLAQAIVADPRLVLLDEPTAGLDPAGRHDMLDLVRRLGSFGISVVMATHLLEDVQETCDQVVMIDAGRLLAAGPTEELLTVTGTVRIDVGGRGTELLEALARSPLRGEGREAPSLAEDGSVELPMSSEDDLDQVVAVVAEAGLPLHALSSRRHSLAELFTLDTPLAAGADDPDEARS